MRLRRTFRLAMGAVSVSAIAIAVSANASSSNRATSAAPALNGQGAEVVVFFATSTDNYARAWHEGARQEAKRTNYQLKIIENNYNQTEENNQVLQQVTS